MTEERLEDGGLLLLEMTPESAGGDESDVMTMERVQQALWLSQVRPPPSNCTNPGAHMRLSVFSTQAALRVTLRISSDLDSVPLQSAGRAQFKYFARYIEKHCFALIARRDEIVRSHRCDHTCKATNSQQSVTRGELFRHLDQNECLISVLPVKVSAR